MDIRDAKTPSTIGGRLGTYAAFVGGIWSVQWLLWFATNHNSPEPTLFGLGLLGLVFLFWFFMPQRYWFRRGSPERER